MNRPIVLVLAVTAAGLLPAGPAAAQDRGVTRVTLSAAASHRLAGEGVRLSALRPATLRRGTLTLPVERGTLAPRISVEHRGALTLRRRSGGRTMAVRLSGLRSDLRSVRATVRGRTITMWRVLGGRRSVDPALGTAGLTAARLAFTRAGATLVRRELRIGSLPSVLGTVATDAALRGRSPAPVGGSGGAAVPGVTPPAVAPAPAPAPGAPTGAARAEPPAHARPASAVDLADVRIVWHPRESWIRYLAGGFAAESRGTIVSAGASEGPTSSGDDGRQVPLEYDFAYAPLAGRSWTDPVGGATVLAFGGSVRFRFVEHGIDLRADDPEIELDGAASRAIFRLIGREGATEENRRAVLLDLHPEKVTPTVSGATTTYERIPATVAEGTERTVFGGFYSPGSEFGWVTVAYTR